GLSLLLRDPVEDLFAVLLGDGAGDDLGCRPRRDDRSVLDEGLRIVGQLLQRQPEPACQGLRSRD
uniref:hypothetical protein n=1 Tax=Micrococcus sp. F3Y TaxID=3402627 RepID=UPI003AF73D38